MLSGRWHKERDKWLVIVYIDDKCALPKENRFVIRICKKSGFNLDYVCKHINKQPRCYYDRAKPYFLCRAIREGRLGKGTWFKRRGQRNRKTSSS